MADGDTAWLQDEATRTIHTDRLILRPHRLTDLPGCTALWSEERVIVHIGGTLATETETWGRILKYAGLWTHLGYGYWAIIEMSTARFVGDIGFARFHRGINAAFDGDPEMGWALRPDFWGTGYAREACQAALTWAASEIAADRTVCLIEPNNIRSVRLAERIGFTPSGNTTFRGARQLMMERPLR